MQKKNILGILLTVCFLMSVTAAAVSAAPVNVDFKQKEDHGIDFKQKEGHESDFKQKEDHESDFKQKEDHESDFKQKEDHREYRNNYLHNHYHPGHWEKHREGHKEYRGNHWVVVYKIVTIYKPAYWDYN